MNMSQPEWEHIVQCSSCKANIIFLRTKNGKQMPVDAATVMHDDYEFSPKKGHISHFATCPDADKYRI